MPTRQTSSNALCISIIPLLYQNRLISSGLGAVVYPAGDTRLMIDHCVHLRFLGLPEVIRIKNNITES